MTALQAGLESLGRAPIFRSRLFVRWKHILVHTFQAITDMDTSLRCAGVAFFGFLSLFPAIAAIVLIYGLWADAGVLNTTIANLQGVLPNMALDVVQDQLTALTRQPPATLGLGLLISLGVALWSGSRGVAALIYAMSRVRGKEERRGFVESVLISVALTIVGAVFLLAALATIAGLPAITQMIPYPTVSELIVLGIRWPILLMISVAIIAAFYRWGPDRHPRKLRYIWPGALLASLLWVLAGLIFSIYVENFGNFEASFGSLTAAVVLLLWMYNSSQIFVAGAAFNAQLEFEDAAEAGHPGEIA